MYEDEADSKIAYEILRERKDPGSLPPAEETDNPDVADRRGFYKVEIWTTDGLHVDRMLHAGNRFEKAEDVFDEAVGSRRGGHYTIRQGIRVLDKWPKD